jgi:putative membrane protein
MNASLRKTALSVALLSAGLAMSAMAQTPGTSTPGTTGTASAARGGSPAATTDKAGARGASDAKLAHADRKFIENAAKGGMAEVQLGQLAAQKAQSAEVKQFGQKMVDDHTKANDQLKQIASSKNVELPTALDGSAKREYDRLSKMSGADFDREYMKHMVSDHKKDVKEFSDEAKSGKDSDVKQCARRAEAATRRTRAAPAAPRAWRASKAADAGTLAGGRRRLLAVAASSSGHRPAVAQCGARPPAAVLRAT